MKCLLSAFLLLTIRGFAFAQPYALKGADTTALSGNKRPFTYVQKMPSPGYNLGDYISENMHYPNTARRNNIQGRVIVQFVVNEDGAISDCKIIHGIGGGCDEEALKVIKDMPAWKAGMQDGEPVKVFFTQPITFSLQK